MTHQGDNPEDYEYSIERGVPIPSRQYAGTPGESPRLRYPFPFMEVGDSFFVPLDGLSYDRRGALVLGSARAFCRRRDWPSATFITRRDKLQEGIRCWRVDETFGEETS